MRAAGCGEPAPGRGVAVLAAAALVWTAWVGSLVAAALGGERVGAVRWGSLPPGPQAGRSPWPVVLVSLDGLTWPWLVEHGLRPEYPALRRLVSQGALALYNPLMDSGSPAAAYLAAAAGRPQQPPAGVEVWQGPWAQAAWQRRIGTDTPDAPGGWSAPGAPGAGEGGLVVLWAGPGMPQAAPAEPPAGWLGELLQEAQVAVEVWGDGRWFGSRPAAALPEWTRTTSPLALASLLAADRQGRVRRVHELAREDPASPLGLATDWPQLARRLRRMGCDRAAVVVASGDLWRLRWEQARMAPQALVRHHRRLAAGLDQVVRAWAEGAGSRCGSLFVAGLAPGPQARPSGEALTALLGWGPWPAGLWWGPTTRRPGLVTAVDLAPALARLAGRVPPAPAVGRPFGVLAAPAGAAGQARAEALARWARERAYIYAYRFRVLPWLTTLQVALLAMAAAVAWWYRKAAGHPAAGARRWRAAVQRALGAVRWAGCVPLALLHPWAAVGPGAGLVGPGWSLAFVSACSLALGWASGVLARRLGLSGAGWVALAGAGVLLADLAGQWDLVARSFMGYDLTAGARFYGIGNEHMGLLLGSTLVVLAELAGRFPWGTALGVALVGVAGMLVGSPARGANVGGTVAFAVALAVLAQGARAARCGVAGARAAGAGLRTGPATTGLPVARALVPVAAAGLAVAGLAWWDAAQSAGGGSATHLAHALAVARGGDGGYLWEVASRKLALNLRLIRYSLYSQLALVATVVVAASLWRGGRWLAPAGRGRPWAAALQAAGAGALAALVANDSGITAAATALLGPAAWVLEQALSGPQPARRQEEVAQVGEQTGEGEPSTAGEGA